MAPRQSALESETELENKNPTEIPIGGPQEPARRDSMLWRCSDCGEMGRLSDALPDRCPACRSPREQLYYWEED